MKISVFCYGTTEINAKMAYPKGNPEEKIPISLLFFLIETGKKKILVDAGCGTMPGFPLYTFCSPVEILEKSGINRTEITDILLTHTHHDHADGLRYYPQAKVYVQENEKDTAFGYAPCFEKVTTFKKSKKIAEGVIIRHIGGHSKGSCIVEIRMAQKNIVLCGDECYLRDNLLLQKPTGSSVDLEKSRGFVRKYSDAQYETVLFHDKAVLSEIGSKLLYTEEEHANIL